MVPSVADAAGAGGGRLAGQGQRRGEGGLAVDLERGRDRCRCPAGATVGVVDKRRGDGRADQQRPGAGRARDRIAGGVGDGDGDRVLAEGKAGGVEVAQVDGAQRGQDVQGRRDGLRGEEEVVPLESVTVYETIACCCMIDGVEDLGRDVDLPAGVGEGGDWW